MTNTCTICRICIDSEKIIRIIPKKTNLIINTLYLTSLEYLCDSCISLDAYLCIYDILDKYDLNINEINYTYKFFANSNNLYVKQKEWNLFVPTNLNLILRKKKLFEKLNEQKLQYKKNSICDAFIKYGKPDIENVIHSIKKDNHIHNNKLFKLSEILQTHNIQYDSRIPIFEKYLSDKKGVVGVDDIVREYTLEKELIENTNFSDLIKTKDYDDAKQICMIKYNKTSKQTINQILTLRFD